MCDLWANPHTHVPLPPHSPCLPPPFFALSHSQQNNLNFRAWDQIFFFLMPKCDSFHQTEGIIKSINISLYLGSSETQSKALGSKFYFRAAYFRFEFVDLLLLSLSPFLWKVSHAVRQIEDIVNTCDICSFTFLHFLSQMLLFVITVVLRKGFTLQPTLSSISQSTCVSSLSRGYKPISMWYHPQLSKALSSFDTELSRIKKNMRYLNLKNIQMWKKTFS